MSTAGLSASLMLDFNVLEISPGTTQAEPNAVLENIYQIFFCNRNKNSLNAESCIQLKPHNYTYTPKGHNRTAGVHVSSIWLELFKTENRSTEQFVGHFTFFIKSVRVF